MAEEMVDVLDEKGNPAGKTILKSEAHRIGAWHRSVHIWIYNSKGELLLQKRTNNKKFFPGFWDLSVGGHVSAGQSYEEAALREIYEEIGLRVQLSELETIETWPDSIDFEKPFLRERELIKSFLLHWDGKISELSLQKDEVAEVKFVSLDDFEKEISDKKKMKRFVPHGDNCAHMISFLRRKLKKI